MMKKRIITLITAAAVLFSAVLPGTTASAVETPDHEGTTYYVSTLRGKDSYNGKSQRTPFYSLRKINDLDLNPGDKILIECGSVFKNGYLHLYGQSGSEDAPIIIDTYGEGANPVIDTNGQGVWYQNYGYRLDNTAHKYQGYVSSSILLYDTEYIEINNLEIINKAPEIETGYNELDVMNRTGVAAVAQDKGTIEHIHLNGLNIHDVIGNVYDKHMNNGGIYFTVFLPHDAVQTNGEFESETGISRYDDVLIENCTVDNVNRWGIAVGYTAYWGKFTAKEISDDSIQTYGSTNVVIRNNYIKDAGGDAITTMYCDRPLVEYNVSDGAARQINLTDYSKSNSGRVAAAIWPWKCKNAVFQYNEVFDTKGGNNGNGDAQAWDADSGDGTLYQYNYSHGNTGGCVMFCYPQAYHNTFRYNISQNDLWGILDISDNPDANVYNNVFYIADGVDFIRADHANGSVNVENNIIYYAGSTPKTEDWDTNKRTYSNNLYYNYSNTPSGDANDVSVAAGTPVFQSPGNAPSATVSGIANLHDNPGVRSVFDGYKLADNSPAIGAGKEVTDYDGIDSSTKDFFGNSLEGVTTFDIGAHQHQENEETIIPPTPQKVETSAPDANSVTIKWPAALESLGIKGYKILNGETELMDISDLSAVTDEETQMITVQLDRLQPGTTYTLSVVAYDENGTLSEPQTFTFTTAKDAEYTAEEEKLQQAISDSWNKIQDGQNNYTNSAWSALLDAYEKASQMSPDASISEMQTLREALESALNRLYMEDNPDQKDPDQTDPEKPSTGQPDPEKPSTGQPDSEKPGAGDSNSGQQTAQKLTAPAVTQVKSVLQKDGVKVQVTWDKVANASSYIVYRTVGGKTTVAGTAVSNTFLDTALYGGKTVTYSAAAVSGDKAKYTDSDAGVSKVIKLTKAPTKLKVKQSFGKAVISWKKLKNAKQYIVFRSTKKSSGYTKVGTVKKSKVSYTDKKVKKKKTYYYVVAAKVGSSYTAMTAPKKIKIK